MSTFMRQLFQNTVVNYDHQVVNYTLLSTQEYRDYYIGIYSVELAVKNSSDTFHMVRYYAMNRATLSYVEACARIDEYLSFEDFYEWKEEYEMAHNRTV